MASAFVRTTGAASFGEKLLSLVAAHGTAAHPYARSPELFKGAEAHKNLADAVHLLCTLHGRHPGVIDHAAGRCVDPAGTRWFAAATDAFASERTFLTRLAVAAGPIPSTPGSAESEAAVIAQRHAIEMLAKSERNGCASGSALALAIDWWSIRSVLNAAAIRFGVDALPYPLCDVGSVAELAAVVASAPAIERALLFGAEQIAVQHFGLWDLLETRQQARVHAVS